MKHALHTFCWFYLGALVLAITANALLALSTEYGNRVGVGCNLYDAMVVGVECRGFLGAKVIEFVLNWPFRLLYYPLFVFVAPWFLPIAILLWAPPFYLAVRHYRSRNAT